MIRAGIALLVLVLLPAVAGSYVGRVLMLVGLYILMGMGLNLEVGLAGLLNWFRRVLRCRGLHPALLTADAPHALAHLSYGPPTPVAVLLSILVGVLFGLPVLGVRGDYLAVATMGLGEIVRVIVQSDSPHRYSAAPRAFCKSPSPGWEISYWAARSRCSIPWSHPPSLRLSPGGWRTRVSAVPGWRCATMRMWRRHSAST